MTGRSESRRWAMWGLVFTAQSVALVLAALSIAVLVGLAVLNWLEHAQ